MSIRGLGAALIIVGCGGFGFSLAAGAKQQERNLAEIIRVLHLLEAELQYHLTPLPELFLLASKECSGKLRDIFLAVSKKLSQRTETDAASCTDDVLEDYQDLPKRIRRHLKCLGHSVGRFDLPGQLAGLEFVRNACEADLQQLQGKQDVRVRSYQTLSLCAGTALAILFL